MKEIIDFLEESRREHYYCEDCFYTCPLHPEELEYSSWHDDNKKCNCGADEYNAKLDRILFTAKAQLTSMMLK